MKKLLFPFSVNLQYFAETEGESVEGQQEPQDKKQEEKFIPKSRFDDVNNRYRETQKQLEEILKEKETQEKEEAEKKGEFERLYQESTKQAEDFKVKAESQEQRVQQLESILQQMFETKISTIPEELHDLIPKDFTIEQKLEWINTAEKKGLFARKKQEQIGGDTNTPDQQKPDLSKLSPIQLIKAGYGSSK
ncbi:hypothetical protein C0R09_18675 [Brevibacillus laterosporus]|uniref:hypothetical protein n=1 Tax=Brevibacillus laterosporus TaxID=1465 RepID=UPI000C764BAD|nr:hypothetical protein [Brevibacillus laterosporus]AUM66381.1 hypothetical protein C0R09_18675 [Brevibacillus laterosporus]